MFLNDDDPHRIRRSLVEQTKPVITDVVLIENEAGMAAKGQPDAVAMDYELLRKLHKVEREADTDHIKSDLGGKK